MPLFKVGIDTGDHLIVEVNRRLDEGDDHLEATISLHAGAFSATFEALLATCDVPPFRTQLETLLETLSGSAIFNPIEGQLKITCVGNGRGGITVHVIAQDRARDPNELRFRLETDQTFLPRIIAELRDIESCFPTRSWGWFYSV